MQLTILSEDFFAVYLLKKINPLTQQRLPWVENESVFTSKCTRCEKCINACEENIIVKGDGGFPIVDFTKGECTFCEGCANSCPEALFDLTAEPVFSHKISINENCLAKNLWNVVVVAICVKHKPFVFNFSWAA